MDITEFREMQRKAGFGTLTQSEQVRLIDYAINAISWNRKFLSLLKLMSGKSSWSDKINRLVQQYEFGTDDPNVILAAKRYVASLSTEQLAQFLND